MSFIALSAALLLIGDAPVQEPPASSTWLPAIEAHLQSVLKDPYSAVKRQTSPVYRVSFKVPAGKGLTKSPWAVCFLINAKNSFGGYVGEQPYLFLLEDNGALNAVLPSNPSRGFASLEAAGARKECARAPRLDASSQFTVPAAPAATSDRPAAAPTL